MTYSIKPATLSVALLSVLALSGCPEQQKTDTLAAAASTAAPAAVNALTLDESKLTPAIRFSPSDLDASKSACGDFGGYVNGKWYAANPIPGDRSSWGAFDALAERSLSVQHQLADQIAAEKNPTG
ncbi:MAG TPA: peptidase, partial [Luteimonas sp.]|nr:peptidase [Luteimonas sp.]